MPDSDITELTALDAKKVSGVTSMANGTPFLLLKSGEGDLDGDEPEAMEEEMTKQCFDDECGVCPSVSKRTLTAADRKKIPKGDFAIPSKAPGSGSYPIHDRSHAENALARASGKPVEAQVRAAVHRRFPDLGGAEKSPGVPEGSTRVEQSMEGGRVRDTGLSGKRVKPMTSGTRPPHAPKAGDAEPVNAGAGETTAVIPDEAKLSHVPPAHLTAKALAFAGLAEFMDRLERQRETAVKADFSFLAMGNPSAIEEVGSPEWEARDASSLKSVAENLAQCAKAIDAIAAREMQEALTVDPSDANDYWDLSNAAKCLDIALAVVARLSFLEGAEAAAKASSMVQLSPQTIAAMRAAQNHLAGLLSQSTQEEDVLMTTVTKAEMSDAIAQSAVAAVKEAMGTERKTAEKAEAKKAKKAEALKNANNGGDITAGEMEGQVNGHHESNDVEAVGGPVSGKYKNAKKGKGKGKKALKKQLAVVLKSQAEMTETLQKFAAQPRRGGPVLDGVPRGAFAANEGRQSEPVAKSEAQAKIETLEKSLAEELAKSDAGAADRASAISWQLTRMKLREGHLAGEV